MNDRVAAEKGPGKRARLTLALSVVATAGVYAIPRPYGDVIAYPLVLLSTYTHEMGHGVAGMLIGASFESFKMYPDTSGVALVSGNLGRLGTAFVSAGGLVGPAVVAGVFFLLAPRRRLARTGLMLFGIAALLAGIIVVRNPFGWVFVGLLGAASVGIAWKTSAAFSQAALAFLAVQLALSVYSRSDYLFTDVAQTGAGAQPSDVANMAAALFLPYWFWGAVCGLFSVAVVALGLSAFWRKTRSPASKVALPPVGT